MKFMKLIFVDKTHEEPSSLSSHEFYKTAKKISKQDFGVAVRDELPQTLTQNNPFRRHQEHDFYQSLIIDLMSGSEHSLNGVRAKLKHLGKESGWELSKYHVSNMFEDTIYACSLPDDWFRRQARYNHDRDNALRRKSLVKIPAAAFYFARISRDIHQIANAFDVTEWAVRKWAKTYEWKEALNIFGYTGSHDFKTQPKRDTERENRGTFNKVRDTYIGARQAGEPTHKLATIAANAAGIPRRRVHEWAMRYGWRESQETMSDWPKDKQEFADVIIKIIESKHRKYEREYREGKESNPVPLADIKICPKCFEDFPHIMQGIRPFQKPESTVQEMLDLFCRNGEIKVHFGKIYMLSKDGLLYRHLTEKLASTPWKSTFSEKEVIPMTAKKSGTRARSAITGKFISKGAAKRHPKTTVVETVKNRKQKK